jgi:MFS family permease
MRVRNFRWYFLSETVNVAGSMMAGVALAFAVLEVSDSPSALGVVLAANSIPLVLFVLWGGVIADRLSRALIMRVGNLVLFATQGAVAALVITDTAEIWMLVLLEVVNGTTLALVFPAYAGLVSQLVPREMLQQANTLNSMLRAAFRVIGPTIGALLVVTVGPGWALAVDSLTWLAASLLLAPVKIPAPDRSGRSTSTMSELREGWSLFIGTTWLWVIVVAFGVLNAISSGAWSTLGPVHAKDTIGEQGWGYLLSAQAVGLLAMGAVMLRRRLERPLLVGMLGMLGLGVLLVSYGVSEHLLVLVVIALISGAGTELFSLGWTLSMQEHIEDRMLSRAYSYDMLGSFVAMPVGQLAYGPLGAAFGIRDVLVVSGVAYILICLATLLSRDVRTLARATT